TGVQTCALPIFRPAPERRGAGPRGRHVGRAPEPPVQGGVRRVALRLPDDAPHRAGDGPAAPRRHERHRRLLRGGLLLAGDLQHALRRAGRRAAQRLQGALRRGDAGRAPLRREAGDATDQAARTGGRRRPGAGPRVGRGRRPGQESRSAGGVGAPIVAAMDITIHSAMLPQTDPEAALRFYRDGLGFEVRNDVEYQGMHWITVGPAGQPETSIVLYPPEATPGLTDEERRVVTEMIAKGTYASINLAARDLDAVFARLEASGAEVVQEPTDQPYGVR